ncbi:nitrate- and nitrite sensing domain-containing protein [Streptomyces sp. B-S-A12]|uniref:histidine kinase n=2 Tax=Streptomyces luteolus TaxID=3043615 RepID=A0ABT6T6R4_9ACTN|nr:nitrate- and nitrite sensing domain-containing protein [Streptomyces sp. B-S-A12]MDI3423055.1 nitrate- and nitrite sensing domain-containing protein [Streptomyces sp. B-S-A12]
MVPVVSLLALWAYATVTTAQDMARLSQAQRVDTHIRAPIGAAVTALQAERRAAVSYATKPNAQAATELEQRSAATDRAVDRLRLAPGHTVAAGSDLPPEVARRLTDFMARADELTALRKGIRDRDNNGNDAYEQYTSTITTAFGVTGALTGIHDPQRTSDARVLLEIAQAVEMTARQDTLLSSARLTGTLDGTYLHAFIGAVETRRTLTGTAVHDLQAADRQAWRELQKTSAYRDMRQTDDAVLTASSPAKAYAAVSGMKSEEAYRTVAEGLRAIESDTRSDAVSRADPLTRGALSPAGAAVLLGLLAVATSLVISVRIGRALVVELVDLRNSALQIARHKLPQAMSRLRAGEELDVHAEAPHGSAADDETGQVAEALNTVHRAALHAAVERAELADGISGVFVNLARRSQILVHRQLNLLDAMERRADDPNELSDLFRLDHLTTRMRRHAESLIILSGSPPGRAWRAPVPLTNVVRAAVAEVEDYARVQVEHFPEAAVVGSAVADVTHLLAELVENATQFSPPHTRVRISGEPVGNGYALEVEDRGLGMGPERLDAANRRIEQSDALDLFDSDRLGLFVVSRLSARHSIKVHLRTSPYGGTTAVVLLPTTLLNQAQTGAERQPRALENTAPAKTAHRTSTYNGRELGENTLHARVPEPSQPTVRPGTTTLTLHTSTGTTSSEPVSDSKGLPRRVRQASLAPQLREQPAPDAPPEPPAAEPGERTPEQVRARMTAYRDGWARGGGRPPGSPGTQRPPTRGDSYEGDRA